MPRPSRAFLLLALALLLNLPALARAADPQEQGANVTAALDAAPADAAMVVVLPNLDRLSGRLALLKDSLGLNLPQLADLLGEFKRLLGVTDGLKEDGPMLLVLQRFPQADQPAQLLLIATVTDPNIFLKNFAASAQGNEVVPIKLRDNRTGFARVLAGNRVLLGHEQQAVAGYQAGSGAKSWLDMVGATGKTWALDSDALAIINAKSAAPTLINQITLQTAELDKQFGRGALPTDGISRAVLQMQADAAKAMIRDAQGLLLSVDITELGVGLTLASQFAPGSVTAKLLSGGGGAAALLSHMPTEPFLLANAVQLAHLGIPGLTEQMAGYLPTGKDGDLAAIARMGLPVLKKASALTTVYYAPQGTSMLSGASLLNNVTVMETSDAPAAVDTFRKMIEALGKLKLPVPTLGPDGLPDSSAPVGELTVTSQYQRGALRLEGDVTVDQYQLSMTLPGQLMKKGQLGTFLMMAGATNVTGYIASKDKYVVITSTQDAQTIKNAVAALEQEQGLGSTMLIQSIRRQGLLPSASIEGYLSVGGMVGTANSILGGMEILQEPIRVPNDLLPLGAAVEIKNAAATGRFYAPMVTLRFLNDLMVLLNSGKPAPARIDPAVNQGDPQQPRQPGMLPEPGRGVPGTVPNPMGPEAPGMMPGGPPMAPGAP